MTAEPTTTTGRQAMATAGWIEGRRATVALVALTALLLVAGAVLLGATHRPAPAGHHAAVRGVAVRGGYLRVDSVTTDSPMQVAGMPMGEGPNMKHVPKGFRRLTIAVTLFAREAKGLRVTAGSFRLRAGGGPPRAPIDDDTDTVFVPGGASFPRQVTFDVPRRVRAVELQVEGADHAVRLALVPASGAHVGH